MTDSGGPAAAPPGWFPDPGGSPQLRWWDGVRWTEHTREHAAAATARDAADRDQVLHEERAMARWAGYAVWVYTLALPVGAVLGWRMLANLRDVFQTGVFDPAAPPPTQAELLGVSEQAMAGAQLLNAVQLASFVVLLVWLFKAASAAERLGIPAKRAPGWAVGAWFIPVLNFWWPYQSLRDLFPGGHPARRRLFLLWLTSLAAGVVVALGFLLLLFGEGGAAVLVVGYVAFAGALLAGRTIIRASLEAHERIARGEAQPQHWP